ncbi:MAG: LytR/AlgR family response regulator transcription factor [Acutalibacteraceae bacterium]
MKIAVCEDDKLSAQKLVDYIREFMKSTVFDFSIDVFYNGKDFRKSKEIYDLVFLDCQLPDINGLDLAKELRRQEIESAIIFVTAYDDYVYESFEVRPFRYILKPIDEDKIRKALIGFISSYEKKCYIVITTARKNMVVNSKDIVYVESDGKYSIVRLINNASFKSTKSISDYQSEIGEESHSFFRTHRCFLVNMKYISGIDGNIINFINGEKAEISRRNVSDFNKKYMNYLKYFAK